MLLDAKEISYLKKDYRSSCEDIIKKINATSRYKINYEDMVWDVQDKITLKKVKYVFEGFDQIDLELTELLKNWILVLFDEYSTYTFTRYLSGIKKFFEAYIILDDPNIDDFLDEINKLGKSKDTLNEMSLGIRNFIEFYDGYFADSLIEIVYELEGLFIETSGVRDIPPTKDILIFSKILEDYFNSDNIEYYRFKPIELWWKLTSIIPVRPIEFLKLKKKNFNKESDLYYVEITRVKVNSNSEDKLISKVAINKDIYDCFSEYIHQIETEFNFESEFIFSYQTITRYHNSDKVLENRIIYLGDSFNNLLDDFYNRVIFEAYKVPFVDKLGTDFYEISKKLRIGDTRHIAFMNLKRLGYNSREIAEIGGHISLKSQNHYFKHVSNLVDLEILNLMYEINLGGNEPDDKVNMDLIVNSTDEIKGYKNKVSIGYCTDEKMICKSRECWYCSSWKITKEELKLYKVAVNDALMYKSRELEETIQYLGDTYKSIYNLNVFSSFEDTANLKTASKKIDLIIKQLVNIRKNVGVD
ncbi:hypothetical protein [Viridibacillus arvi]|uniref:hypothetical protein n=1 Tax=Viridibacillus arvi TaxID=263475 RepID=UPI003D044829